MYTGMLPWESSKTGNHPTQLNPTSQLSRAIHTITYLLPYSNWMSRQTGCQLLWDSSTLAHTRRTTRSGTFDWGCAILFFPTSQQTNLYLCWVWCSKMFWRILFCFVCFVVRWVYVSCLDIFLRVYAIVLSTTSSQLAGGLVSYHSHDDFKAHDSDSDLYSNDFRTQYTGACSGFWTSGDLVNRYMNNAI